MNITGVVKIARPAKVAATGLSGYVGVADVKAGSPKVKAAGSARLYTGTATVAAYRANIAAKGIEGSIGQADVARKATIRSRGHVSTHVMAGDVTLSKPIQIAAVGTTAEVSAVGTGTLVATATLTGAGTKAGLGTATLVLTAAFASGGRKDASGTGDIVVTATMAGAGAAPIVVPPFVSSSIRRWPIYRQQPAPVRRGHGVMELEVRMWAIGYKSSELDDELVLALAA